MFDHSRTAQQYHLMQPQTILPSTTVVQLRPFLSFLQYKQGLPLQCANSVFFAIPVPSLRGRSHRPL
jgi:hypothetical protein